MLETCLVSGLSYLELAVLAHLNTTPYLSKPILLHLDTDLVALTKPWIRLGTGLISIYSFFPFFSHLTCFVHSWDLCTRVETPWDPYIRLVIMTGMCFL
jgi:hypothetical protein